MANEPTLEMNIHPLTGGTITCYYGPPASLHACQGSNGWKSFRCKNPARYRINGTYICLHHAQVWAFAELIGKDNIADPVYGRVGG